ncbi:P-loop containing nucleoside triphosphate hydrolase [Glarea lozoyensis ATCC 20868]|uniref:p-loop containing nucleoside triphosphate hydrolase n=1 Tax=Glarea lozoyensis (strain ATCC 20868 / MF5171) TaxID=1116229 RepID=S3E1W8_GLAL2|nr:P-loop containing nucleoside triphosphate hydrolase [Glarea lozoyensis ATCC 20868]EPE32483.1 P-loop containing nucleoside triphosphate hydrolase [Glarea lozoyensis ATCC 20868]
MGPLPQSTNYAGELAPVDEKACYTIHATTEMTEISSKILAIVFEYALNKFDDSVKRLAAGIPKFLQVIDRFVLAETELKMCLPAFPFKSANKIYKVLGSLPDKAEELALERLNTMCTRIGEIYPHGAKLTIISDGLVYNDLLSIPDRDTWAYGEALRAMAAQKGFSNIEFSRLKDLVNIPMPEKLEEITYVANATNFRRLFLNEHGKEDLDINHEIATNPDMHMTYLGYRRFLESDLKYIFPLGKGRSGHSYKRDVKYLAKQMLIRGHAFAGACKSAFPDHLRLSIHQSTGEHKISMSLLDTKTGFTTPWHCSVALLADGGWISAPKGDFEKDARLKVVYEDGRPSYFQEKKAGLDQVGTEEINDIQASTLAISTVGESEEDRITQLAKGLSRSSAQSIERERNELINPFLGSKDPSLDPHSEKFNPRAWLETLMRIESRNPEKYPKRVAGIAYRNLSAYGFGEPTDYQKTFGNYPFVLLNQAKRLFRQEEKTRIDILRGFDGLVKSGEMLVVLGRPGSGCSTLLKTISGETDGFFVANETHLNYQGIPKEIMHKDFRGECIYQAENDVHFPQLTVSQILHFAARARAPRNRLPGVSREAYADHLRDVTMAVFGLSHAANTVVGNDFVRGVSGGERKRVSIAEAAIGGSPLQCWDNSTRGLDSATALQFVRTLRTSTELTGATAIVALYQASEPIYDVFDKVAVLYEGRQIYFGAINAAKRFFITLGFECSTRQTTADFLTSLTNPAERIIRKGFEGKTPNTPDEFSSLWQRSQDRANLLKEIDEFDSQYPIKGPSLDAFRDSRKAAQARSQRIKSPYTLSVAMQIKLCVSRGYQRLLGDKTVVITGIIFNSIMALVVGSVFYNLPNNTASLFGRGTLLFFGIQLAAFASALEILTLYAQRPIVEKQSKYAFYHPFAEAIASMICDLPNKLLTAIGFDLALYFMTNLRRTPGHFFVFLLFTFTCTLTMSMYFRCIAALSRTLVQAMAPGAIFGLSLVMYTGFTIPIKDMHPWFRWINYLNPVAYAYESLMINEFHNSTIPCTRFIPEGASYSGISSGQKICATTGAASGADFVDGDVYLATNFQYSSEHLWRNLGIMIALMIFGCVVYLIATEYISAKKSKGEVLLFRRGHVPDLERKFDEEALADGRLNTVTLALEKAVADAPVNIQKQTAIFHWDSVSYDINTENGPRRLLNDVDGWIVPGRLTALMGFSGAGKTTLLDVLASRVTMGIVSGQMLVDGQPRDTSFQRKTGYVQQQDLHLATSTVREALIFSAILRQPEFVPYADKLTYVGEVIKVLEMEAYADAIIGVPGEGLNVEQRKRLTIGVELAAKPALLLFLDEPTSGLDSQTAWSICTLLRKLANHGQAILCTIHQPSAILFQEFDRLLCLAPEGKTVYFGEIGESSEILTAYFEGKGARACGRNENPAEWMLEIIGTAPGSDITQDWAAIWGDSKEHKNVKEELLRMKKALSDKPTSITEADVLRPFAASFVTQFRVVLKRIFQQYWRTPSYLYSKVALCLFSALFIGFSFWRMPNTLQGLQNQLFAIFLLLTIFANFAQQILPNFVTQRALYEVRERPSKTYCWQVFILSNVIVEIPWNTLMALLVFLGWYYPIDLRQNAVEADQVAQRGALMFLFILVFLIFSSTFTHMVIAGVDTAEAAGNITNLLFSLALIFCGVLATPAALPGFWIFMYRVSPLSYLVSGMLSVGLANSHIFCSPEELLHFSPPSNLDCATYLAPYAEAFGGYLSSESINSFTQCAFCSGSDTNVFLKTVSAEYDNRWSNFGICWAYVGFNITAATEDLSKHPDRDEQEREGLTGLLHYASCQTTPRLAQTTTPKQLKNRERSFSIGYVVFPGWEPLDVFGPLEMLFHMSFYYNITLSIISNKNGPVSTIPPPHALSEDGPVVDLKFLLGPTITATHTHDSAPPLDILFVPGGKGAAALAQAKDTWIEDFVATRFTDLDYLLSVCTGAASLARSGVLNGKKATTNKAAWSSVVSFGTNITWVPTARWVVDENIWTSSGVAAGLDMTYAFLTHLYGSDHIDYIMNLIEYAPHTNPHWDPFSVVHNVPEQTRTHLYQTVIALLGIR